MLNKTDLCDGIITRSRIVNGKVEKSVIDFVLVCAKLLPFVRKMKIDKERKFTLTNFCKKKKGNKAKSTDHNPIYVDFSMKFQRQVEERKTFFNYKDEASMKKFRILTSKTTKLTNCFKTNEPFAKQVKKWEKTLQSFIHQCFKKIRKTDRNIKNTKTSQLLEVRRKTIILNDDVNQEDIENKIKRREAKQNMEDIIKNIEERKQTQEG